MRNHVTQNLLKKKAGEVVKRLAKTFPQARVELNYTSPLELLVATILSAQCTDVKVNQVTVRLFGKYRRPEDYLRVPVEELAEDIRATGFFRQKSNHIRGAMHRLIQAHGGEVPGEMEALTHLPGVGRKTANVILGNIFGVPGIVVDTHMIRVSNRLGLTAAEDPLKVETELGKLLPARDWIRFSQVMVLHGRYLCKARKPQCEDCPLMDQCDYFRQTFVPKAKGERRARPGQYR